jgi:hypothetical protein
MLAPAPAGGLSLSFEMEETERQKMPGIKREKYSTW